MKHTSLLVVSLVLVAAGVVAGCVGDSPTAADGGAPSATATTDSSVPPADAAKDTSVADTSAPDTSVPPVDAGPDVIDAAPAFDPKQVPGLALWLDPSVGITEVAAKVSSWTDQSASGLAVTQITPANQPAKGSVNSKPVLVFGASNWLEATSTLVGNKLDFGTGDLTVEVVCAIDSPTQVLTGVLYKLPDGAAAPYDGLQVYGNLGGGGKPGAGLDGAGMVLTATSGNTADGRLHLLGLRRVGTKLSLRLDGSELLNITATAKNVDSVSPLQVGGRAALTHNAPNKVGDVLIYKGSVSDTELAKVEAFLKAKNGI